MDCSNHSPEGDKKATPRTRTAYHKRYYVENKERILARQKQWRTENAGIIKARLDTNNDEINRKRREYRKQNKERVSGDRRKYREKYRERIKEKWRKYYAKNKERINQRLRDKKTSRKRTRWDLGPTRKEEKADEYYREEEVMRELYEETVTPERTVVDYKGGHVERDLLDRLNIPSMNLKLY
ncbi:hypothetical protein ACROYT_G031279 [Oculina patagonica]